MNSSNFVPTDTDAPEAKGVVTTQRVHPETILIPLDFSKSSDKALEYGKAFARQFEAKLILVHVLEPMVVPAEMGYGFVPPPEDSLPLAVLREKLAKLASSLGTDLNVSSQVRIGRPWSEVVEAAKESSANLLVVATHGRTGLQHVLLGSVAEKIIRHAPCPVLVVRSEERDFV
ncbi:MAG TPA: universal stress protein [Candidatus Limnocylindria bacterium]|jgi:nucleotide-binding universal stress UspA family protein|nr:universal stress protein [Candidatus Limnocylindria bacterium]